MDPESSPKKIELVLAVKKKMVYLAQTQKKSNKKDEDDERMDLHLACIELLSTCSFQNHFGISQARKLIRIDTLFDSILSEAVPYLFKKRYLNLLYHVYISDMGEFVSLEVNTPRFLNVLKYVVLEDLTIYSSYYLGLLSKVLPEAKRDNEVEKQRIQAQTDLDKLSRD